MRNRASMTTERSWNQEELRRSAHVAKITEIRPIDCERYLNPPSDTAYPLEYAYSLLAGC